ncbi:hypothetical protein [uncultured Methanobrevibacter sp.]|uniref:hypothetical protein n=1 Tax=uncultured Methanobrevibacter sp. TaxID=253161 RepID=UPI0025D45028|nr:hypothetical protein [uncultured Methanobrevibacter sp.]
MDEMFDIGIKASNFKHLKELYHLEDISKEDKLKYQQMLEEKNPDVYEQVLNLKKRLESEITNIKEVILDGADPIINDDLLTNV